jgi:hypothetical protein
MIKPVKPRKGRMVSTTINCTHAYADYTNKRQSTSLQLTKDEISAETKHHLLAFDSQYARMRTAVMGVSAVGNSVTVTISDQA